MKTIYKTTCARLMTLLVLALLSTNLAWGETYTISFVKGTINGTNINTQLPTNASTMCQSGSDYITNFSGSNAYYNSNGCGIRLAKSGSAGSLVITLSDDIQSKTIKEVIIYASAVASGNTLDVTPAGTVTTKTTFSSLSTYSTSADISTYAQSAISINGTLTSLIFGATSKKYVHLHKIDIVTAPTKTLESIAVKTLPSKTTYYVGEDFDPAGLVITATYDDENTEDIAYTEANKDKFSFSGFNSEAVATNQEITVTYGEKSATFNVDVDAARTLNSIEVATNPTKMVYEVGESLDLAGLVVNGIFSKGDPEAVEYIADPAAGTTLNVVGTTTVTLTSVDNPGLSTSFNVTVKAIEGDRLTPAETGVTSSSYSAWGTSYTAPSGAVYTGLSAGSYSSIQLRSDATTSKPASGIISTTSGGFIKKVKVAWESHTAADRELEVFGSNVAYASVADLVDNVKKGTSLGTIKNGTSTELVIDGNYAYVGVRSKSGAMYLSSITFVWGTQATVEISPAGWATACLPFNVTVTGADAYYVTVEGDNLTKAEARVIPAGAGVLLKGVKDETTTATFTISADAPDTDDNMMVGSLTEKEFKAANTTYYILAKDATNGLGFYYQGADNTTGASVTCAAGKAVLAVPTGGSSIKSFFSLDDETTSIQSLTPALYEGERIYNLNGQVVGKDYKGIVIVNGKKMLNK